MTKTYTTSHRIYYLKNKDRILEKTQEYRKEYQRAYYLKKKALLAKKKEMKLLQSMLNPKEV